MTDLLDSADSYRTATFPTLRPFQVTAHQALRQGVREGHKNQILVAPTGAGKLLCGLHLIYEALRKGKRAMFVCERNTLIEQACSTADKYGMGDFGVIQAQHWRFAPSKPFQIASAQTLARRGWPEGLDLCVVDEAHVMMKPWVDAAFASSARFVGLTATPMAKGLGKIFTNLINAATMAELVESGVLVPMRVLSCKKANMKGALTNATGEWTDEAAEERGMEIVGDVVTEWQKYADGLKTIVFGATIAHCEEMCRQFNECGVMAAVFCATTTDSEREQILKDFRRRDSVIRVVLSVDAISRGFDIPDIECVVDCRPLRKSISTWIQMIGRGLRSAPEKSQCLVLDHSGNAWRFAKDFEDIYFNGIDSLDKGEKLDREIRPDAEDEREVRSCPKCGYSPFAKRCISCGHETKAASLIQHEASDGVVEIMIGKSKAAENKQDLWNQVASYCRANGKPETSYGRATHLFREITGVWPPEHWGMRTVETVPSKALLGKIRANRIRWAKGNAKAKAMA